MALAASGARGQTAWESSAYKGWKVSDVKVVGLDKALADDLRDGLALAYKRGFLGRNRPVFYPETLAEDIRRCVLFLARRGYPHARVVPSFEARPARQQVSVVFSIDTGPPVLISGARAEGLPEDLERDAQRVFDVLPNTIFTDENIARIIGQVDSLLVESGHARSKVDSRLVWGDSTRVTLVVAADAGPVCYFGNVGVHGADDDVVGLAHKTANIRRGSRYSRRTLRDAQRDLRALELFRQVRLEVEDGASPDTLDINIEVGMREFRTFDVSGRYWSDDGLSGGIRWIHRNRFKRGRGGAFALFASGPTQLVRYSVWWPAVIWPRSRAIGSVGSERQDEEAYELLDTGVQLSLRYDFSQVTRLWVSTSVSNVDIKSRSDDLSGVDKDTGLLTTLSLGGQNDTGNDPIVPTRGHVTIFVVEWAPPGGISDNHYIKGEATEIVYIPAWHRTVLAGRVSLGLAEPINGSTEILPNKRFYSGGSNSMRGFHRRKLGPLDADGAPLGGEAKLEFAAEYRFPLPRRFGGTLFLDSGQVWPTIDDMRLDNIELAAGFGLWINTIVGPIRGDVAYRLTFHEPSQPRWVFHFSVGPAF